MDLRAATVFTHLAARSALERGGVRLMLARVVIGLMLCMLWGCTTSGDGQQTAPWQAISGRDGIVESVQVQRQPIYRARVPSSWQQQAAASSVADTTLPLAAWTIPDPQGDLTVAVHNFPSRTLDERVPPQAQVARWRRQLNLDDPVTYSVMPSAHGGFVGLQLEGPGILAWTMQLAVPHFRTLESQSMTEPAESSFRRLQQRADYTIKVTGPDEALQRHRGEIMAFARSFELIEEIPVDL